MTTTFRTMTDADLPSVVSLVARVFGRGDSERENEIAQGLRLCYAAGDIMKVAHGYVADEDGRITSRGQVLDLQLRLGAVTLRVAGLHALVTEPHVQARSLMLPMVRYGLHHVRAQGFDLGMGFTQHHNVFSVIGGTTVAAEHMWEIDAHTFAPSQRVLTRATDNDFDVILPLIAHADANRPLSMVRTPSIWRQLERRPQEIWVGPGLYLGLRRSEDAIEIREIAASAEEDYAEGLAFVAQLARAAGLKRVFGEQPPNHSVAKLGRTTTRLEEGTGCMAAIIDVERFLLTVKPEIERRAGATPVSLLIHCEGRDHTLQIGTRGEAIRFVGSRALLLKLILGTLNWRALLEREPSANLSGPHEILDKLFAERFPHTPLCERW